MDDIADVTLQGLGESYIDALDGHIKSSPSQIIITQETDRVYTHPEKITHLYEHSSHVTIHHLNASDVVLWNPWSEAPDTFSDILKDDYRHMVCVETARITTPLEVKEGFGCEFSIQPIQL